MVCFRSQGEIYTETFIHKVASFRDICVYDKHVCAFESLALPLEAFYHAVGSLLLRQGL